MIKNERARVKNDKNNQYLDRLPSRDLKLSSLLERLRGVEPRHASRSSPVELTTAGCRTHRHVGFCGEYGIRYPQHDRFFKNETFGKYILFNSEDGTYRISSKVLKCNKLRRTESNR